MYFLVDSLSYIGRWLLMHGSNEKIIKPDSLKTIMKISIVFSLTPHYMNWQILLRHLMKFTGFLNQVVNII